VSLHVSEPYNKLTKFNWEKFAASHHRISVSFWTKKTRNLSAFCVAYTL
jgi:hypothetical protein